MRSDAGGAQLLGHVPPPPGTPSTANATSPAQSKRCSHSARCARSAGAIGPAPSARSPAGRSPTSTASDECPTRLRSTSDLLKLQGPRSVFLRRWLEPLPVVVGQLGRARGGGCVRPYDH